MEERRRDDRRESDRRMDDFEQELAALRFIVTGHRDAPATGLVRQIIDIDSRVTWMIRSNIAAVLAVAGAAVGRLFS